MRARTEAEWDAPHRLPEDAPDPFTIFVCNEQKIAWLRAHPDGYPEGQVLRVRRRMDRALSAYRAQLAQALTGLSEEERADWRSWLPQAEFWGLEP